MEKLKHLFIFAIIILLLVPLAACEKTDPRKDYKTAKPSYISSKNIFYFSRTEIKNANFTAKKVLIYNDFSAEITYELKGKSLEKEDAEEQAANSISKENIIEAIENYNKERIYSDDSKLFEDNNRVLYLDEESIKEETIVISDKTETTNIVLSVYVTNLSYVCNYYKLMTIEDYVKAEEAKSGAAVDKAYRNFIDLEGKRSSIDILENPENFGVFVLEGSSYSPNIETEFTFENKIAAYYSPRNRGCKVSNNNYTITITPESSSSTIAVMYQINGVQPLNWAILGPVIGAVGVFLILLSIKIIQTKKKRTAKGR